MAQKPGVIFENGDEVRIFMRGRNQIIVKWLTDNAARLKLPGAPHPGNVSRALVGGPSSESLVQALNVMLDEMRHDPWAWCEPPERIEDVEGLQDYASYKWWYDLLRPTVPFSRFERMPKHPLQADEAEFLQERLSDWRSRLKGACDQYRADFALVEALRADMNPEYQRWVQEDSGWRLVGSDGQERRVGNPGLHGRSADEIARAYGLLRDVFPMPLPLVAEARLIYERPEGVEMDDFYSEPVEPWNGQEFEGVEWAMWEDFRAKDDMGRPKFLQVEHKVVYYWDGSRYQVADVDGGQYVRARPFLGKWHETTPKERDVMISRINPKHPTMDELLATRDQWVADTWASHKEDWAKNERWSPFNQTNYPDGVPESVAAGLFEAMVERLAADPEARAEQKAIVAARRNFKLGLRRRP